MNNFFSENGGKRFLIFIILSSTSFLGWAQNRGTTPNENKDCQEALLRYYEVQKKLIAQLDSANQKIQDLTFQMTNSTEITGGEFSLSTPRSRDPIIARLQAKIERMMIDLRNYQEKAEQSETGMRALQQEIRDKEGEINAQIKIINEKITQISELETLTISLSDSLQAYTTVLSCIEVFQTALKRNKAEARREIAEANEAYENFFNQDFFSREDTQLLKKAWGIYKKYGAEICSDTICNSHMLTQPVRLVVCEDYLTAEENLHVARIAADFPEIITDQVPDSMKLRYKLNLLNEIILINIGKALSKGNFTDQSDTRSKFISLLPTLIVEERRRGEFTETLEDIKQIKVEYVKGNYDKALYIYNNLQRLFNLKEMREPKYEIPILEAKYCVGIILLWNLGDVGQGLNLAYDESWLGKQSSTRQSAGEKLLQEVSSELNIKLAQALKPTNLKDKAQVRKLSENLRQVSFALGKTYK